MNITTDLILTTCAGIITIGGAIKLLFGKQIEEYSKNKTLLSELRIKVAEGERHDKTYLEDRALLQELLKFREDFIEDMDTSKIERKLMIKGFVSVCKRLEETGANGTVSGTRKELENYLYEQSHK